MFDLFSPLKKKLYKPHAVEIDNRVFKLHYKASQAILLVFTVLVTSVQYFGQPISCIIDEIPQDVIDAYCWIYSTFTVSDNLKNRIGLDVIQPGVKPFIPGEDDVKYHKYYQWVSFVLFFQAVLFYIPHYIWKTWEKNRIRILVQDLRKPISKEQEEWKTQIQRIADYFEENRGTLSFYAYQYFFCEVLNFVNVVGQMFFMDYFLEGEFSAYGLDVLQLTEEQPERRTDAMAQVFPKVTKCNFRKYGPSGTVQNFDGLCVLPLNIVNEKIFVILWFWFVALAIVTGLFLIYRLVTIFVPVIRKTSLLNITSVADKDKIRAIADKCDVGDWLLLNQLGVNIDPLAYKRLIVKMHESSF